MGGVVFHHDEEDDRWMVLYSTDPLLADTCAQTTPGFHYVDQASIEENEADAPFPRIRYEQSYGGYYQTGIEFG